MKTAACSPETLFAPHPRAMVAPWLTGRVALLALCMRWTSGNRAEAEDLLGDACLRILECGYREGVDVGSPIAFWATVINNLGRDRARRHRRWQLEPQDEDSDGLNRLPASTINAEHQLLLRECLTATARQLTQLNKKQRTAVLLRSRGFDYSGIGECLQTTAANARKLVETARKRLNAPAPRRAGSAQRARAAGASHSYPRES